MATPPCSGERLHGFGEGRAFCVGGDIKNLGKADPSDPLAARYGDDPRWNEAEMRVQRLNESAMGYNRLRSMPKPTIARVEKGRIRAHAEGTSSGRVEASGPGGRAI